MSKLASEVRDLSDPNLAQALVEARTELFNLRFQRATGALDNTARLKQVKRQIARIETFLRQREIAAHETTATSRQGGK